MADGESQLGPIQRVEVEVADAFVQQVLHLFDGDARGNQTTRFRIVIQTAKTELQPIRNSGATSLGETQHLREARDRQDARHDRRANACPVATIAEAQERFEVVEELSDRVRCAGIDLAFRVIQIELRGRRFRMLSPDTRRR